MSRNVLEVKLRWQTRVVGLGLFYECRRLHVVVGLCELCIGFWVY